MNLSVRHDLQRRFGPVRDQGARDTCLAIAISDLHGTLLASNWVALSVEYLIYYTKVKEDGPLESSISVPAICHVLEENGQPIEEEWPYLTELPSDLAEWKPPLSITSLFYRSSHQFVGSFDEIWNTVESGKSLLVGFILSESFYQPSESGLIESNGSEVLPDSVLGHAVLAVGTGEREGERLLLVRNSWGKFWGILGYAWVSENYLAPRILMVVELLDVPTHKEPVQNPQQIV